MSLVSFAGSASTTFSAGIVALACHHPSVESKHGVAMPNERPSAARALHPIQRLRCFAPESLSVAPVAFGSFDIDSLQTQDASGTQFTFVVQDGTLRGTVRDARGEIPKHTRPIQSVAFNPRGDSLSFFWTSDGTEYSHQMRVSCDSLWGRARLFVTATYPGQVVERTFLRASPVPDSP